MQPYISPQEHKLALLREMQGMDTQQQQADTASSEARMRQLMQLYGIQHQQAMDPVQLEHERLLNTGLEGSNARAGAMLPIEQQRAADEHAQSAAALDRSARMDPYQIANMQDIHTLNQAHIDEASDIAAWRPSMQALDYTREDAKNHALATQNTIGDAEASFEPQKLRLEGGLTAGKMAKDFAAPGVPPWLLGAATSEHPIDAILAKTQEMSKADDLSRRRMVLQDLQQNPTTFQNDPNKMQQLQQLLPPDQVELVLKNAKGRTPEPAAPNTPAFYIGTPSTTNPFAAPTSF